MPCKKKKRDRYFGKNILGKKKLVTLLLGNFGTQKKKRKKKKCGKLTGENLLSLKSKSILCLEVFSCKFLATKPAALAAWIVSSLLGSFLRITRRRFLGTRSSGPITDWKVFVSDFAFLASPWLLTEIGEGLWWCWADIIVTRVHPMMANLKNHLLDGLFVNNSLILKELTVFLWSYGVDLGSYIYVWHFRQPNL